MKRLRRDEAPGAWQFLAVVVMGLVGASCEGCESCQSSVPLATLQAIQGGEAERDFAAAQLDWKTAKVGAEFQIEDGLRTADESTAVMSLFNGSMLTVQPGTQIRFRTAQAEGQQNIEVATGEALIRTGARPMTLETLMGTAILSADSQVRLQAGDGTVRYAVEVGSAVFRTGADDQGVEVEAGQQYEVGIGEAVFVIEPPEPEPELDPVVAEEPEEEPEEEEGDAEIDKQLGSPSVEGATVRLGAGGSLIIHSPEVPAVVGVNTGGVCPGRAVVQVGRPSARYHGEKLVGFEMGAGSRTYSVHCVNDAGVVQRRPSGRGRVRLLRDSGNRRLPKRAPSTRVEADGRSYHVLYQNQLPNVTVSWPRAPDADAYIVDVDGKPRTVSEPEVRFRSGELGDGTHKVSFAAGGRKSREATIVVAFDNAAPKAAIAKPDNGSFAPGDTVNVSGVALPGWKVESDHGTIEVDSSHRFSGQVTTSSEHPDVVLRLTHPHRGTHVYIRQSRRSQ